MAKTFAPKTVALLANTPATIQWLPIDFQTFYGYYPTDRPISVEFAITNPGTQAIYVGLSYTTQYESIPLIDKRAFSGVSSGSSPVTVNITPRSVAALANLKPFIQSITLTLTSLANVNVTVVMRAYDSNDKGFASGGAESFIGADKTLISDYYPISGGVVTDAPVGNQSQTIATPSINTRHIYTLVYVSIPLTPYQYDDLHLTLYLFNPSVGAQIIFEISSEYDNHIQLTYDTTIIIPYTWSLRVDTTNNNPLQTLPYIIKVYGRVENA